MSRAAIFPTLGDPVLLNVFLKLYDRYWSKEVDVVYANITNLLSSDLIEYFHTQFTKRGFRFYSHQTIMQHGDSIKFLLNKCEEEYVVLLEDDIFILGPNRLSPCFSLLENNSTDCVGSSRCSCSSEIIEAMVNRFKITGRSPEHSLNRNPNFWPSLFFSKTSTLLQTDQNFNAIGFSKGQVVPIFNFTTPCDLAGDTFVWTTIQLFEAKKRMHYIHQHHAGPEDFFWLKLALYNKLPWIHFGSLSGVFLELLLDDRSVALGRNSTEVKTGLPRIDPASFEEMARRMSFFELASEHCLIQHSLFEKFNNDYIQAIAKFINFAGIPRDRINFYKQQYKTILMPVWEP